MADFADIASSVEADVIEHAISIALQPIAGVGEEPIYIQGKPHCVECGERIPLKRLKAIKTNLCVDCASQAQIESNINI